MSSDVRAVKLRGGAAVTASDTTKDPAGPFDALIAYTTAGKCKVTAEDGSVITIYLALGHPVYLGVRQVWTTGTDAAGITGLYASLSDVR